MSVRKSTENPKLRPFLSSHFNQKAYLKTVVEKNESKDVQEEINEFVEEVNEEIKGYISTHKDELMGGMQDVAVLSERYNSLCQNSLKLRSHVERIKNEVTQTHDMVNAKTNELDRIHSCAALLRQLRQFMHARSQLLHYLESTEAKDFADGDGDGDASELAPSKQTARVTSNGDKTAASTVKGTDIRFIATAAKNVADLEALIANVVPGFQELELVKQATPQIQRCGARIREIAEAKFLAALGGLNQAAIGSALQVFFNLKSLPEIILRGIDHVVAVTVRATEEELDLAALVSAHATLAEPVGNSRSFLAASLKLASSGTGSSLGGRSSGGSGAAGAGSQVPAGAAALRLSLKDMAHSWSLRLLDCATQVAVLQRVVVKKQDPVSNMPFSQLLHDSCRDQDLSGASVDARLGLAPALLDSLAHGALLQLFFARLSAGLGEVLSAKLRAHPTAALRLFPSLRKACTEVEASVAHQTTVASEGERRVMDGGGLMSIGSGVGLGGDGPGPGASVSLFGAAAWCAGAGGMVGGLGQLGSLGGLPRGSGSAHGSRTTEPTPSQSSALALQALQASRLDAHRRPALGLDPGPGTSSLATTSASSQAGGTSASTRRSLADCLTGLSSRFLAAALGRMQSPVLQMFPAVDGYTATVPSRQDVQTATKAIHAELVLAAVEADAGLMVSLSQECLRVARLLLSKAQKIALTGPESARLTAQDDYTRSPAQEHNASIVALLLHVRDAFERLPTQVLEAAETVPGSAVGRAGSIGSGIGMGIGSVEDRVVGANGGSSGASAGVDGGAGSGLAVLGPNLTSRMAVLATLQALSASVTSQVDGLLTSKLLARIVDYTSAHACDILAGMADEGIAAQHNPGSPVRGGSGARGSAPTDADGLNVACSQAVETLCKGTPLIVERHFQALPRSPLVATAIGELCNRVLAAYISAAALVRPVTEASRLRCAKDMAALEVVLASLHALEPESSPALREFRAFQQLLFAEEISVASPVKSDVIARSEAESNHDDVNAGGQVRVPNMRVLLNRPFVQQLRPSTLLGHLAACAPAQLPAPYEPNLDPSAAAHDSDLYQSSPAVPVAAATLGEKSKRREASARARGAYIKSLCVPFFAPGPSTVPGDATAAAAAAAAPMPSISQHFSPLMGPSDAGDARRWRDVSAESAAWKRMGTALDIFVQRLSVADPQVKTSMRAWYESLVGISGFFFSDDATTLKKE
jgi:hypothetical protein